MIELKKVILRALARYSAPSMGKELLAQCSTLGVMMYRIFVRALGAKADALSERYCCCMFIPKAMPWSEYVLVFQTVTYPKVSRKEDEV